MPGPDELLYYGSQGQFTDPGPYASLFDGLSPNVSMLCRVVHGLVLHVLWAGAYGVTVTEARRSEMAIRPVSAQLEHLVARDARPLGVARDAQARMLGTCRDFALMLCGMLRHLGVSARVRCGFATYFRADHYEDHWVVQYWRSADRRWVVVDPQLDTLQREQLRIDFDPADLPDGRFLPAARAWQMYREGEADPEKFGIPGVPGRWFIRCNVVRDLLALNKLEISPWDTWRLATGDDHNLGELDLAWCDRVATATQGLDVDVVAVREIHAAVGEIHLPPWRRVAPDAPSSPSPSDDAARTGG